MRGWINNWFVYLDDAILNDGTLKDVKNENINIHFNTVNIKGDITTAQKIVAFRFADAIQHSTDVKWT